MVSDTLFGPWLIGHTAGIASKGCDNDFMAAHYCRHGGRSSGDSGLHSYSWKARSGAARGPSCRVSSDHIHNIHIDSYSVPDVWNMVDSQANQHLRGAGGKSGVRRRPTRRGTSMRGSIHDEDYNTVAVSMRRTVYIMVDSFYVSFCCFVVNGNTLYPYASVWPLFGGAVFAPGGCRVLLRCFVACALVESKRKTM